MYLHPQQAVPRANAQTLTHPRRSDKSDELRADLRTTGVCGDPASSSGSRGRASRGCACPQSTSGRQLCGDVRLGHARRLPTHYGEGRPAWRTDLNRQTIKNRRLQHRKIAVQVTTPDEARSPLNPDPICLKISDHLREMHKRALICAYAPSRKLMDSHDPACAMQYPIGQGASEKFLSQIARSSRPDVPGSLFIEEPHFVPFAVLYKK